MSYWKVLNHFPIIQRFIKDLKRLNLTATKTMSVEFPEIWKSYPYTYSTKTALKEMGLKRNITQTNF